jgi:glycosyltransferase involved in cell wall biosynthesis
LVRENRISAIYATSPPTTPAVVAYLLSLLTRRPLIIDLRDPWILQDVKPPHARSRLSDALDEWLERRMTVRACAVISATSHYTEYLRKRYPQLPSDQFLTIHNGFDPPDFSPLEPRPASGRKLTMTYVGTFYLGRTPRQLLEALGNLLREKVIDPSTIQVRLIGDVRHAEGDVVEELIRRNSLNGCVHISDPVPYQEALREVQQADILLLFAPRQHFSIPGKAFEYLAAQKYILCFGTDGATADLVQTTGAGLTVNPYDVAAIAEAIASMHAVWMLNGNLGRETNTQPFQRRELTRRLASLLDRYCGVSPRQ